MMKSGISFFLLLSCSSVFAQTPESVITVPDVTRIESTLASDSLRGRKVFTPDIDRAADFIVGEFRAAGLIAVPGYDNFKMPFSLQTTRLLSASGTVNGQAVAPNHIAAFTSVPHLTVNESSGYVKIYLRNREAVRPVMMRVFQSDSNYLVVIDTTLETAFNRLASIQDQQSRGGGNAIFVLGGADPSTYSIDISKQVTDQKLNNVLAMIPGKSKSKEFVIFSAHYDHLGVGKPDAKGDSIFNGANDDASGCTAVMMLARYFAARHDNERTLIFTTFTAEEIGELGSAYFSKQFDPATVAAMVNIEMIGKQSKWGIGTAYITGYDKSSLGDLLNKNLAGSPYKFYPDPYTAENLFYRSDNAQLAKQGVPAHTLSTSQMDSEKTYHTPEDELATLDLDNMTAIIRAIAQSATGLVKGTDTPSRVKK